MCWKIKNCPLDAGKWCCGSRMDLILELLVFCPSYLYGSSKCNRLYHLKRKGEKQLYEKFGYKAKFK